MLESGTAGSFQPLQVGGGQMPSYGHAASPVPDLHPNRCHDLNDASSRPALLLDAAVKLALARVARCPTSDDIWSPVPLC